VSLPIMNVFENIRKMFDLTSNNQLAPTTGAGSDINILQRTTITLKEGS